MAKSPNVPNADQHPCRQTVAQARPTRCSVAAQVTKKALRAPGRMALQRLVLVDSTGFGWLEPGQQVAAGRGLVRPDANTAAVIVCGGSLLKGNQGAASILGMLQQAIATKRMDAMPADRPVCCRAVPARNSVPDREYGGLVQARREWGVAEAGPSIMECAGARYGGRRNALHFQLGVAADGIADVVAAAVAAYPARASHTLDVVLCCGWNCNGDMLPLECFAAKCLTNASTWQEFVREVLTQAGAA